METKTAAMLAGYPDMMRPADVAQVFGVSLQTVYRMQRAGQLPVIQIGRRVFFPRDVLAEQLAAQLEGAQHGTR